jgi:hypothetical protein
MKTNEWVEKMNDEDVVLQKIDNYVDTIINQTTNNTIIMLEYEILDKSLLFSILAENEITCEKTEIQEKDIYYIIPKCYHKELPLAGILLTEENIFFYPDIERDMLKETLRRTLLWHFSVKSKTFYEIFIKDFLSEDKYSYLVTSDDDLPVLIEALKTPLFAQKLNDEAKFLILSDIVIVRIEPKSKPSEIPKYAIIKVHKTFKETHIEASLDILEVPKEVILQLTLNSYDRVKQEVEHTLSKNKKLREFISKLED